MRIADIYISNYKSIKELRLSFTDHVNLLIGPNGSGKTNVLNAINDCFLAFLVGDHALGESDYWFGIKNDIEIICNITHKDLRYPLKLRLNKEKKFFASLMNQSALFGYYRYIPSDRYIHDSMFHFQNQRFDIRDRFHKRTYYDSKAAIQSYVNMIINSPDDIEELSQVISGIYPDIEKIYFELRPKEQRGQLVAIINDFAFPLESVASGLQQLILMFCDIYYSKESLILIDEPGLHMNPKMIIALSNLIKQSSEKNKNQFIIGTHSTALISTKSFNIIPLEYKKIKDGYSTTASKIIPEEFVDRSFLNSGKGKNV